MCTVSQTCGDTHQSWKMLQVTSIEEIVPRLQQYPTNELQARLSLMDTYRSVMTYTVSFLMAAEHTN